MFTKHVVFSLGSTIAQFVGSKRLTACILPLFVYDDSLLNTLLLPTVLGVLRTQSGHHNLKSR